MPLVNIKLIEDTLTSDQKQQLIEKVTDAVVEVEGENLRPYVWVVLEDVKSGEWGVGGQAITTEAVAQIRDGDGAG